MANMRERLKGAMVTKRMLSKLMNGRELQKSASAGALLTGEQLRRLQETLLEMYLDVDVACKKHGCEVFLCGGSALGSVRHQGFIPWDDDFDVAMTRDDYEKFSVFFEEELGDKYYLNAPDRSSDPIQRFPKILKKGTKLIYPNEKYVEGRSHVFLDIFLVENCPDNRLHRVLKGLKVNFYEGLSAQVYFKEHWNRSDYCGQDKALAYLKAFVGTIASGVSHQQWMEMIDRASRYENNNSEHCCIPTGRKHYFGEMLKRSVFFPASKGMFKGHEVNLFHDVNSYLTNLYGQDYMTLPPVEKREHHPISLLELS